MKILYFSLFLLFTVALSAQESLDFLKGGPTEISEVKLYPNPAFGGVVNIITAADAHKEIAIYDVFGEVVLMAKLVRKTLDISRLSPGVYVLQINEGSKTFTRKLVVK